MSKIGLNTLNSNPGRATSAPGFSGGNLSKAVSELKSYTEGTRKTKPSQKMLDLLEKHNVISKTGAGMPKRAGPRMKPAVMPPPPPPKFEGGKVNRLRKANRWADFSKKNAKDGIDLGSYGYEAYDRATNPMKYALVDTIKGKGYQKASGYQSASGYASAGAYQKAGAKPPSKWIQHVKAFAQTHNISYKDALSKASASYHANK